MLARLRSVWPQRGRHVASAATLRVPAVVFLIVYCGLLLCVPSQLIVRHMGAPGTPANLWGVCGLLWWSCATLAGQNPVRGMTPLRVSALLLVAAVLGSYTSGMTMGWYAPAGLHQTSDDISNLITPSVTTISGSMMSAANRGLISFACWLGVVLLAGEGLRSWRDLDLLVTWVCRLGAFVALLGFVQYFWGIDIAGYFRIPGLIANAQFGIVDSRSVLHRVSSTAVHPIEYGVVLGGIFPLALHRTIHRWGQRFALVPSLLIGVGMLLSVSRSAVLVAAVSFLILVVGWPVAWRRRAFVLTPILLVLTRLAFPGLLGTLYSLFHDLNGDPSVKGRTQDYHVVFHLYSQQPVFGRGMFTFIPLYYRVLDNQILIFLLELGAVGLVAVLLFFLVAWVCARSAYRFAVTSEHRHLGLCLSASLAGVIVSYLTFDAWSFPMAAGVTFVLVGLSHAVWRLTDDETGGPPRLSSVRGVVWESAGRGAP
jgi:O-antigen ligase